MLMAEKLVPTLWQRRPNVFVFGMPAKLSVLKKCESSFVVKDWCQDIRQGVVVAQGIEGSLGVEPGHDHTGVERATMQWY